jgi:hypothetical protein
MHCVRYIFLSKKLQFYVLLLEMFHALKMCTCILSLSYLSRGRVNVVKWYIEHCLLLSLASENNDIPYLIMRCQLFLAESMTMTWFSLHLIYNAISIHSQGVIRFPNKHLCTIEITKSVNGLLS